MKEIENKFLDYFETKNVEIISKFLKTKSEFLESKILPKLYLNLPKNYNENCRILHSSGSSGGISSYQFSPTPIIGIIEEYNKVQSRDYFVFRIQSNIFYNQKGPYFLQEEKNNFLAHVVLNFSILNEKILEKIQNIILSYKKTHIAIFSNPHFFLFANSHRFFEQFCVKNKILLISTDYTSFYKKNYLISNNIQINDCMINWKNGLNYYHCQFNKKHCLPFFLFYKNQYCLNLLNLKNDNIENCFLDDLFDVKNTDCVCSCGKKEIELNFIPHREFSMDNYNIHLSLIERLNSNYLNIQFIESQSGEIDCLYSVEGNFQSSDKDKILSEFKDKKINFYKNCFLFTGKNKIDFFYKNKRNLVYQKFNLKNFINFV